jgi:hypothetical protein
MKAEGLQLQRNFEDRDSLGQDFTYLLFVFGTGV